MSICPDSALDGELLCDAVCIVPAGAGAFLEHETAHNKPKATIGRMTFLILLKEPFFPV